MPDYELVVAKGGPKLTKGAINPNAPKGKDGKPITGSFLDIRREGQVLVQGFTMEKLAYFLGQGSTGVGRVVKDKTGLTGEYSFGLNWAPSLGAGSATMGGIPAPQPASTVSGSTAQDDSAPSIFVALQEQLGLKLQPGTATIDAVVVDHVERPTEN